MPLGFSRLVPVGAFGVLLFAGSLVLAGCDGAGSKQASLYERLAQKWTVERVEEALIPPNRLDSVQVTFRQDEDGREYRISRQYAPDSTETLVEGAVVLGRNNELRMVSGFERVVSWDFEFQGTQAVFDVQSGSLAFLNALTSGGARSPNMKLRLAPVDE
jgi:hypothetical protein